VNSLPACCCAAVVLQLNSRKIHDEPNVLEGLSQQKLFLIILALELGLQVGWLPDACWLVSQINSGQLSLQLHLHVVCLVRSSMQPGPSVCLLGAVLTHLRGLLLLVMCRLPSLRQVAVHSAQCPSVAPNGQCVLALVASRC
jgi:hypothetical protein